MMNRKHALIWLWVGTLVSLSSAPVWAQQGSVEYRLEPGSSFSRGCYPPCQCPIFTTEEMRGTYTLTFVGSDPLFNNYTVEGVNWVVTLGDQAIPITGSGYYRIGGEFARQHQMVLELTIGDEAAAIFDSGLIVGGAEFPQIRLPISMHGMVCFDTVIDIHSGPQQTESPYHSNQNVR